MSRTAPALFTIDVGDTLGQTQGERYVTALARLCGCKEDQVRRLTEPELLTTRTQDEAVLARLAGTLGCAVPVLRRVLLGEPFTVFTSAPTAVAALAQHAPVVTVSNSHPWHAHHHQQIWQACRPYLSALHTSYELGVAKPDPRVFAAVAEQHRVPAEGIVHIGDSWHDDVEGAMAAGCRAVWLSGEQEHPPRADPDRVACTTSITTVPRCLRHWLTER